MSLAQRRTTLEGLGTLPPAPTSAEVAPDVMDEPAAAANDGQKTASIPIEDGKDVWQALSYDPFGPAGPPQVHHYESFPPELGEHVAAYEVSSARRIGQVAFAVVACVLASGIVCGFAALKPILIAEGVYASFCPADWAITSTSSSNREAQIPCPEQDMRLNFFFIAASITLNVSTVLAGYVLDNHGRRACYLLSALILFLGGNCMALAFHIGKSLTFFDGYLTGNLLLGLGGTFLFVSSYQLSNALPRHAGLVVALVTGAFDASAAVFLFYRLAYEATHGALKPAFFFAAFALLIPALIVTAEFALMSGHGYNTKREYQAAIAHAQQEDVGHLHASSGSRSSSSSGGGGGGGGGAASEPSAPLAQRRAARLEAIEAVTGDAAARRAERRAARARDAASGVRGILTAPPQSVARQMRSPWFVLLLLLTGVQMTRMNYFIATVRAQYRFLLGGDEAAAARVNGVFDVALPAAGVATTPFIGLLLNSVPVWATMAVLTGLVVVLGVLNCVAGSEAMGYATVVAFVLYRPLYYSAVSDYTTKVFGFATFGRIYGTVICVSGLGQLIQPVLDSLTHGLLHENPIPLNIAFAVLGSVIAAALTLFVYVKTLQNEASEKGEDAYDEERGEERRGLLSNGRGRQDYGSA